jgi:hypothetical protein
LSATLFWPNAHSIWILANSTIHMNFGQIHNPDKFVTALYQASMWGMNNSNRWLSRTRVSRWSALACAWRVFSTVQSIVEIDCVKLYYIHTGL